MTLAEVLPFLIPLLVLQLVLIVVALRDLLRTERRVRGGNKVVWALVILFLQLLGPLVYLALGREDE
jgi:hypothetical protein